MLARSLAVVIVALAITDQTAAPSEKDWQWLETSREPAFDRLLPVTGRPEQVVAYRNYRDLYQDVPERYLRMEHDPGSPERQEAFMATVVTPLGSSIQQQLLDLHRSRPGASLESVLADVVVRRTVVHSTACTPLKASLDSLSGLTTTIPRRDIIILHPSIHRFVIDIGTDSIDLTLYDDQAPLVRWVAKAMVTVERCGA
jgi:hypothetical protein